MDASMRASDASMQQIVIVVTPPCEGACAGAGTDITFHAIRQSIGGSDIKGQEEHVPSCRTPLARCARMISSLCAPPANQHANRH